MIGAAARGDERAGNVARGIERTADQLERGRPVQPHAALRSVHRLGHAEAERPQAPAVGDRRVPVDGTLQPRVDGGQRVGDDMRGRISDAVEAHAGPGPRRGRAAQRVGLDAAVRGRKLQGQGHDVRQSGLLMHCPSSGHRGSGFAGPPVAPSGGRRRRRFRGVKPSAPARRSSAFPSSSATPPRPAARPSLLRAASTDTARRRPRGG